jgi:hypothetical protein
MEISAESEAQKNLGEYSFGYQNGAGDEGEFVVV